MGEMESLAHELDPDARELDLGHEMKNRSQRRQNKYLDELWQTHGEGVISTFFTVQLLDDMERLPPSTNNDGQADLNGVHRLAYDYCIVAF